MLMMLFIQLDNHQKRRLEVGYDPTGF